MISGDGCRIQTMNSKKILALAFSVHFHRFLAAKAAVTMPRASIVLPCCAPLMARSRRTSRLLLTMISEA